MTGRIPVRIARFAMAALAITSALAIAAGAAGAAVIYNNMPSPMVKNLPSLGFEATSTSQFGGLVEFGGTARKSPTVIVAMSSWACQSGSGATCQTSAGATFPMPITLNVYSVGAEDSVGSLIGTDTETFAIPYRPSAKKSCANHGYGSECFNGKLSKIKFKLAGVTLPQQAIVAVAYNTTDHGYAPTHVAGPYDSLNVAVNASYTYNEVTEQYETDPVAPPSVGSDPLSEDVFVDSTWSAVYCGNGALTGSFGASGACWKYEQPAIEIQAGTH